MSDTTVFADGNYRYIPGVLQYSAGVAAEAGHKIVRVTLASPLALDDGFELIAGWLKSRSLPLTAFCACELRSPAPFTDNGFAQFNARYAGILEKWGVIRDGINPVARSNVCPKVDPPSQPSLFAFGVVVAADGAAPSAIIAGSGEVPEGLASYQDHIIAPGDTSPDGMKRKAAHVVGEMQRRLQLLGFAPPAVTAGQVYSVEPIHGLLESSLIPSGLVRQGVIWHYARPPIVGLSFEMDVRVVHDEQVVIANA